MTKNKTIFKEIISALYNCFEDSTTFNPQKLNSVRICTTASNSNGCWENKGSYNDEPLDAGIIMHNGAEVVGFPTGLGIISNSSKFVLIDVNAGAPPNQEGIDVLSIILCAIDCTTNSDIGGSGPRRTGTIHPNTANNPTESVTLWNSLWE